MTHEANQHSQKRELSEMFQTSEYVSDYETDAGSQVDTRSEISGVADLDDNGFRKNYIDDLGEERPVKRRFAGPSLHHSRTTFDDELRRTHNASNRYQLLSMNAYDRHKKLVNDYIQYYGGSWKEFKPDCSTNRHDIDVIREHGRFLWSEKDEPASWSERLAKRYWDKLFKEYCLIDLSRYKENKFGMRWRVEKEVISGKGQFACGSVRCTANATPGSHDESRLRSWEVNFAYKERGERRNALVKVRLCPACSEKLNHCYRHRELPPKPVTTSSADATPTTDFQGDANQLNTTATLELSSTGDAAEKQQTTSANVWDSSSSRVSSVPKSREDEFDAYFSDLLL